MSPPSSRGGLIERVWAFVFGEATVLATCVTCSAIALIFAPCSSMTCSLISPTSGWTSRKMSCCVCAKSRSSVSKASYRVEMRCIPQKQRTHAAVPTHVSPYAMVC